MIKIFTFTTSQLALDDNSSCLNKNNIKVVKQRKEHLPFVDIIPIIYRHFRVFLFFDFLSNRKFLFNFYWSIHNCIFIFYLALLFHNPYYHHPSVKIICSLKYIKLYLIKIQWDFYGRKYLIEVFVPNSLYQKWWTMKQEERRRKIQI